MEVRRVVPVLALSALLVADAALIAWALRPAPAVVEEAVATSGSPSSQSPGGASPTPSGEASASPTPGPPEVRVAPLTRVVSAVGDDVVWVADSGTCRKPGTVWVSNDRGRAWSAEDAPGQVLRVRADSDLVAFVTGGDAECALRLWSSEDGAATWLGPTSAAAAWSRVPGSPRTVTTSSGQEVRPCRGRAEVVDLAPLDVTRALALCDTGQVRTTTDGGAGWSDVFALEGTLALAIAPDASAAVLVGWSENCDGVVATPVRNGEPADEGECIESAPRTGEVAAAASDSRWWIVVDDEVFSAAEPEGRWRATGASLDTR
jgi:hypothetical protein